MLGQKQAEEAIVSNFTETETEGRGDEHREPEDQSLFSVKSFLWHGGSVWDAWFSCASNQVCPIFTHIIMFHLKLTVNHGTH